MGSQRRPPSSPEGADGFPLSLSGPYPRNRSTTQASEPKNWCMPKQIRQRSQRSGDWFPDLAKQALARFGLPRRSECLVCLWHPGGNTRERWPGGDRRPGGGQVPQVGNLRRRRCHLMRSAMPGLAGRGGRGEQLRECRFWVAAGRGGSLCDGGLGWLTMVSGLRRLSERCHSRRRSLTSHGIARMAASCAHISMYWSSVIMIAGVFCPEDVRRDQHPSVGQISSDHRRRHGGSERSFMSVSPTWLARPPARHALRWRSSMPHRVRAGAMDVDEGPLHAPVKANGRSQPLLRVTASPSQARGGQQAPAAYILPQVDLRR